LPRRSGSQKTIGKCERAARNATWNRDAVVIFGPKPMTSDFAKSGDPKWLLLGAVVIGLRHATDPDHLAAMSALIVDSRGGRGMLSGLGLVWGLGHAATVVGIGSVAIAAGVALSDSFQTVAELAVAATIAVLACRLGLRWWSARKRNGARRTRSVTGDAQHIDARVRRTFKWAFGVGLIHGVAGSAGASILVMTLVGSTSVALLLLAGFALAATVGMAGFSGAAGIVLTSESAAAFLVRANPILAVAAGVFAIFYAISALQ
jgi:hypothetical protein